ncbi:MAG: HU family DNA-binding protein [Puniceicoccales bacterium]|jgi:DNA-binding protein HU-beta|nr:HU family DNA-binding protein [Puniceicoccales bacterium]
MNKSDLITETHKILGDETPRAVVERVVNAALSAIRDAVGRKEPVQLVGFGTFSVAARAPRTGVNPRTKARIRIPGKLVVKFRPGAELNRAV